MTTLAEMPVTTSQQRGDSACDFCGLPLQVSIDGGKPRYCCYGCRFAASIAAADGDEGQAQSAMTRLGLAIFFSMNVMVFTMLLWSQPVESPDRLANAWYGVARYACLLLTLPVIFLLAGPLVTDAAEELRHRRPTVSMLLAVGVLAALVYSIWSLWTGSGHVYFEVPCTVLVAFTLGRWFEATGKLKTTAVLRGLKKMLPEQVRIMRENDEQLVHSSALVAGDVFRVLPGERIAADGEVVRCEAAVDEQAVTGESLPVLRGPGDRVISGTLVVDGPLEIRANAAIREGTLARMIEAVVSATSARTRYERLAEKVSRWLLPAVMLIAISTFAIHAWMRGPSAGLLAGLAVLVIACPCALGLATPMALWAAVGRAAQAGILVRDGDAFAALGRARAICFDKTGTLTTGGAAVESVHFDSGSNQETVLSIARALSRASNHPLSDAITRYTQSRHVRFATIQKASIRPGLGIAAQLADDQAMAYLGSERWMAECGQQLPQELASPEVDGQDPAAQAFVAWNGHVRARFDIREALRPEVETCIELLKRLDIGCVMLSGDRAPRTKSLAKRLGLDYQAALLPSEKLDAIRAMRSAGPVVMVGDGLNDAPALAGADVGIALGSATDISRHAAEVCLFGNDLSRLPWLVGLARRTVHTVRWNLAWAFGYNFAGIGLAAAGWLHPAIAAIAMTASSVLVVANSLSLGRFDLDGETGRS